MKDNFNKNDKIIIILLFYFNLNIHDYFKNTF